MPSGIYNHRETKTPIYTSDRNKLISRKLNGRKQPTEYIKKRSESMIGKHWKVSNEGRKNMSNGKKGKPAPWKSGERSNFWKGGVTSINSIIRHSLEYKLWRESVFKRDNWTCIWCGTKKPPLNADHIKPFAFYPELRFAIDNGRTLCVPCHKNTSTWGYWQNKKCRPKVVKVLK